MIKLDFEKVFDNVNWNFLINALAGFGFSSKWISWIKICIHSTKFFILINGTPKGYFGASNGLKQGDPLCPLLFISVTHILNRMLYLGKENHLIKGILFPHNGPNVLNIKYADDTLLFLESSDENLINLKRILCCFQVCSGLKINFHKSSITGIGINYDSLI